MLKGILVMRKIFCILLIFVLLVSLVSCGQKVSTDDLWQTALYTADAEIGNGEKTLTVNVTADEKTVVFTIHTDNDVLGDALIEHKLISGEQGTYGLYVKSVNGIYADYNTTKSYWSVNKNGEYMTVGVDSAKITDGESYEFIYTKN